MPAEVKEALSAEIDDIRAGTATNSNAKLGIVGRPIDGVIIKQSLPALEPFLLERIKVYDKAFDYINGLDWLTSSLPFEFSNVWLNFQYKHDYVPPHLHSGILSYVIWVKIPYDIEAERAQFPTQSGEQNTAAAFNFIYSDSIGRLKTHTLGLTSDDEWEMVMFPSSMMHYVNPFRTSNEPRISISGNIRLKT